MDKREKQQNRKSPWRFLFWGCIAYGGLELLGGLLAYALVWLDVAGTAFSTSHAATVGIIGGADGPTAIFITAPPWAAYVLPVLALLAGISGLIWLRKNQRTGTS